MLITEHEPCKAQKELMESLGFRFTATNDSDTKNFGKSTWDMHIKGNYGEGEFDIIITEHPKAVPRVDTLLWHVAMQAFVLGKAKKMKDIQDVIGVHPPYEEMPDA